MTTMTSMKELNSMKKEFTCFVNQSCIQILCPFLYNCFTIEHFPREIIKPTANARTSYSKSSLKEIVFFFRLYSNSGSIMGFKKGVWSFMVYVTATPTSEQNGGMRPKPILVTEI
jgi:hypothetical protein